MPPSIEAPTESQEISSSSSTMNSSKILHKLQQSNGSTMAMAVRVYLIRHGETNWNKKGKIQGGGYDVPLNDNGKAQALKAAKALEGISLDAVASSSLSRAKETADIVYDYYNSSNSSKKPLRIVNSGFNEMRFGKFEGIKLPHRGDKNMSPEDEARLDHFFEVKANVWKNHDYCFLARETEEGTNPDDEVYRIDDELSGEGESINIVTNRSIKALSDTLSRVLAETSSEEPRTKHVAIVSHGRTNKILLGAMLDEVEAQTIQQNNCNISVLDHPGGWETSSVDAGGGWTARLINSTDHVKEPTKTS